MSTELSDLESLVGKRAVKKRFVMACDPKELRNYEFAQEIYAALSHNKWCLTSNPAHVLQWKRKEAATAMAAARKFNELYCDFVPSSANGGVPEGSITMRAKGYLNLLGYVLVKKGRAR